MESQGLIKCEERIAEEATRRVYHITPKGSETLAESKSMFANFQQRWGFLRRIMIELIDPEDMATHFVDNSKQQFQLARELLERRSVNFPDKDTDYMLREYVLNLERQLVWAKEMIGKAKPKLVASLPRQKGRRQ